MTREEAIKQLESLRLHCRAMIHDEDEDNIWAEDVEALDVALTALRRDRIEKVWSGCHECSGCKLCIWNETKKCNDCKNRNSFRPLSDFCPKCGKPLTDEAVQIVMRRLEVLKDEG